MNTADSDYPQLISHLVGDYIFQTDHMASRKTAHHLPALLHALTYTAAFLPITRDLRALATIGVTHFFIDRYRLARYLTYAKNLAAPREYRAQFPHHSQDTGYPTRTPADRTVWLMIAADNTLHLGINRLAIRYLSK
jgi:Protein of unknown function (DUF3307)